MNITEFNQRKNQLARLAGCLIYVPDASSKGGYKLLNKERTVYVDRAGAGLAVINKEVVNVERIDMVYWKVVPN